MSDFLKKRAAAADPLAYEAMRLVENGWTADRERSYQKHAGTLGVKLDHGPEMIEALERAAVDKLAADLRAANERKHIAALAAAVAKVPPPQPAAPIAIEDGDIPFEPIATKESAAK